MTKKLVTMTVAAVVVALAGLLGMLALSGEATSPSSANAHQASMESDPEARPSQPVERRSVEEPGPSETKLAESELRLFARVVDARSRQPITGARVALHGPQRTTLLALQRRFHGVARPTSTGSITSRLGYLDLQDVALEHTVDGQPPGN